MTSTDRQIEKWISKVYKVGTKANNRSVRNKGAQVVKKALKTEVKSQFPKVGREPVEYKRGKKKGRVYHPGNLDRSIALLTNIKTKNVTYVGPRTRKGGPVFKGASVDGYYAHMLDRGTKRGDGGIRARRWFEPTVIAVKDKAKKAMGLKALEVIRREAKRGGIG